MVEVAQCAYRNNSDAIKLNCDRVVLYLLHMVRCIFQCVV